MLAASDRPLTEFAPRSLQEQEQAQADGPVRFRLYLEESPLHGLGTFTHEAIRSGDAVIQCRGLVKHKDEVVEGMRALQIGPETYLCEDPENPGMDDLINHSCAPNLAYADGSLMLYAIRDIGIDEELTLDYSTAINEPGWVVDCHCGEAGCRGKIQSFCDLPDGDRDRLRNYVLAYLR